MKLCKDCQYCIPAEEDKKIRFFGLPKYTFSKCKRTWQSPVHGNQMDERNCYDTRSADWACGAEGRGWEAKEQEKPAAQNCPICGAMAMIVDAAMPWTCCSNIGCDLFHIWIKIERWNRLRYERDKEE